MVQPRHKTPARQLHTLEFRGNILIHRKVSPTSRPYILCWRPVALYVNPTYLQEGGLKGAKVLVCTCQDGPKDTADYMAAFARASARAAKALARPMKWELSADTNSVTPRHACAPGKQGSCIMCSSNCDVDGNMTQDSCPASAHAKHHVYNPTSSEVRRGSIMVPPWQHLPRGGVFHDNHSGWSLHACMHTRWACQASVMCQVLVNGSLYRST
jgi:hypothetical protein